MLTLRQAHRPALAGSQATHPKVSSNFTKDHRKVDPDHRDGAVSIAFSDRGKEALEAEEWPTVEGQGGTMARSRRVPYDPTDPRWWGINEDGTPDEKKLGEVIEAQQTSELNTHGAKARDNIDK